MLGRGMGYHGTHNVSKVHIRCETLEDTTPVGTRPWRTSIILPWTRTKGPPRWPRISFASRRGWAWWWDRSSWRIRIISSIPVPVSAFTSTWKQIDISTQNLLENDRAWSIGGEKSLMHQDSVMTYEKLPSQTENHFSFFFISFLLGNIMLEKKKKPQTNQTEYMQLNW